MLNFEIQKNKKIEKNNFDILLIKNLENFITIKNDIELLIMNFNDEYKWDKMFDIEDVKKRVINNETLFVLYYEKNPIGYVFMKKINENTCYAYNLFVTKKNKRPSYAAYWFYNKVTDIILSEFEKIQVQVEEWNWNIIDIIKNIGYNLKK